MKVVLVLCVTATCVVAASGLAAVSAEPPIDTELRSCSTRGDSSKPQQLPVPAGVSIGPLVIWPSIRTRVEPTERPPWAFYVKAPIVLPARAKVTLAIARRAQGLAEFQSARRPDTWVSSVRFEACRESVQAFGGGFRVGKYTGFPFGLRLTRASACIPMEVWVEGETAPIRRLVPVGRRSCS